MGLQFNPEKENLTHLEIIKAVWHNNRYEKLVIIHGLGAAHSNDSGRY